MEQQPTQKSHRVLFVIVGAVILLAVVVGTILYFVAGQNAKQSASTVTISPTPTPAVASKEQVKQNLSDLDSSIKQAQADQAAAQQAIKDSANQSKIGS